jgi:hypothetical protein
MSYFAKSRSIPTACVGAIILLVSVFVDFCFAQSTTPWPGFTGGEGLPNNLICSIGSTPCCTDTIDECTSFSVYCGLPYDIDCFNRECAGKRPYGTSCGVNLGGACRLVRFYCCQFRLYSDKASCDTQECWYFYWIDNACGDPTG